MYVLLLYMDNMGVRMQIEEHQRSGSLCNCCYIWESKIKNPRMLCPRELQLN